MTLCDFEKGLYGLIPVFGQDYVVCVEIVGIEGSRYAWLVDFELTTLCGGYVVYLLFHAAFVCGKGQTHIAPYEHVRTA